MNNARGEADSLDNQSHAESTNAEQKLTRTWTFLSNLLQMLPLLGISAFEKPSATRPSQNKRLFIETKGLKAEGYESTRGFVVCAGSDASLDIVPSMQAYAPTRVEDRKKLITSGVLVMSGDRYQFTQDYSFSSPSTAATIVMGRNANGRTEWKDGGECH